MSAESYTISINGTSNNTDLILESASSNILEGGTNTIEQTIVADPTLSNDVNIDSEYGEIRTTLSDMVFNVLDIQFSSKYNWTKFQKERFNIELGNVLPYNCTSTKHPQLRPQSKSFTRNYGDIATKHSLLVSPFESTVLELNLIDNSMRSYCNLLEALNRDEIRKTIKMGSSVLSDYPDIFLLPILYKSASCQKLISNDKKMLYVTGSCAFLKITQDASGEYIPNFIVSETATNDIIADAGGNASMNYPFYMGFELDENEQVKLKNEGNIYDLTSDNNWADPVVAGVIRNSDVKIPPSSYTIADTYNPGQEISGVLTELPVNLNITEYNSGIRSSLLITKNNRDYIYFGTAYKCDWTPDPEKPNNTIQLASFAVNIGLLRVEINRNSLSGIKTITNTSFLDKVGNTSEGALLGYDYMDMAVNQNYRPWHLVFDEVTNKIMYTTRYFTNVENGYWYLGWDADFNHLDGHNTAISVPTELNGDLIDRPEIADLFAQTGETANEDGTVTENYAGKTWKRGNFFYNSGQYGIYNGILIHHVNVFVFIDLKTVGKDNLHDMNSYKFKSITWTQSPGWEAASSLFTNIDNVNNKFVASFPIGNFQALPQTDNTEKPDGWSQTPHAAMLAISIDINELLTKSLGDYNIVQIYDKNCPTLQMSIEQGVVTDFGRVYNVGGYLGGSSPIGGSGYNRLLIKDDRGNDFDYSVDGTSAHYDGVNNNLFYDCLKSNIADGGGSVPIGPHNIYVTWFNTGENNTPHLKKSTKIDESGLNISLNEHNTKAVYGLEGINIKHNSKNYVSISPADDSVLFLKNGNTYVGQGLGRYNDERFYNKKKNNICIGTNTGNVINAENNILIGNTSLNTGKGASIGSSGDDLKDIFAIGNNNKLIYAGNTETGTAMMSNSSYNNSKNVFDVSRNALSFFNDLDVLYTSFGIVAGYGLNKFDMPRELVSQLDKLTNKMNELIVALNASTNSNIEPASMGPSGIKKIDIEFLIDIGYDGWSSEVYGEIVSAKLGKQLTIERGSLLQKSVPSLNPLSITGSIPLTDNAANGNYELYKFPLEMNVDNNMSLVYWSDEYGDLASHTHIVLEDKFKYMDFPHAYGRNFVLPVFAENTPTGNELTVAMLRVINTNIGTGALANTRIITTACELTNTNSKLNLASGDSIINKATLGNNIGLNMSQDNMPGSGIGPYYPVVKFNFETTNPDGTIKNWAPMTIDSAIREWFKDGETYSGFGFFAGHRKGHMFNIADCVDKASVKVCILDGEEAEDNVVPGSEVLFAPHIEGEVGPDATWDQRFNSALNLTGGSFWADNNITYKTTEYGITNTQMKQLLQNGNPGGYYRDFAVWNPLVMLVHMPQSTWGQTYVIKLDVDLTPYGLRKEHIEMRFVADSY